MSRAVVTGGAGGIGAAIADRLAADGYQVVVLDRDPSPAHRTVRADLADEAATAEALAEVLSGGPVTRLVNNVGAVFPAPVAEQTLAEADAAWALNARSALQCVQAVLPGMRVAGFGRIVSVSSRAALGKELRTAYAASKGALLSMTRVWALELGDAGITVNAVAPGPIRTPLFEAANPPDSPRTKAIVDGIPVRRMGEPEDVAHAASFFLDPRSGFVTGQVLYVCGGVTAGLAPL